MNKKEPDKETEDSFKAVKMTLNQFCSNTPLKKRINEFVLNANKIMFEAYALANLHIINLINQKKKIPILTSSLHFDVNLHHKNFLNLNFRLRKIHVQNLETRG